MITKEGYTPELLASGQLAGSKGTLFEVETGLRAVIEGVVYYNTTGGALTCNTYINDGTTSRQYDKHSVDAGLRYIAVDSTAPIYLDAGGIIEGDAGSATSINYFIFGQTKQRGA